MKALGYEEGRNLQLDVLDGQGDLSRLPALARELVARRPDVIVAANPAGVGAVFAATRTLPIVMGTMSDPVLEGFVASLARPGGNVTGVVNQGEDLIPKHFEFAREIAPRAKRIAFLINRDPALERRNASFQSVAEASARGLRFEVTTLGASNQVELDSIRARLESAGADILVVPLDPLYHAFRKTLVAAAGALRIPAIYPLPIYSEDGGLISYGFNLRDSFRRAAVFVDKILKGARPGELPVERPLKFELTVNLKTAGTLGVRLPQSLLMRADRVIE
jgi:putative ABC transport system substrate-binding protein